MAAKSSGYCAGMTPTPGEPGADTAGTPSSHPWHELLVTPHDLDSRLGPTPMLDPDWIEASPWSDAWSYRRT